MDRRKRLRWLATPEGMRSAALTQEQRRQPGRFVVGGLRLIDGRVVLHAVEQGPAFNIIRDLKGRPLIGDQAQAWYRWRTRQAATQFVGRWGLEDLHVFDLDWADVLSGSVVVEATSLEEAAQGRLFDSNGSASGEGERETPPA